LQQPGLPFADVLSAEEIQAVFDEQNVDFATEDDHIYTPPITLWAFLSQVLFKREQRSCGAAVARIIVLLTALGRQPPSGDTGAYCRARAKVPVAVLRRLASQVADRCERKIPKKWLWFEHHVKVVDGSTSSMPDTEENQAEYPQHTAQQEGLGFPIVRYVVLFSLATAMITDLEMGPYSGKETGEPALLRELLGRLEAGDVLLGDCCYGSYFMICLLLAAGVDIVTQLHQCRTADFSQGQRLGKEDHLVEWSRPAKPEWMDEATYAQIPPSITVREVLVRVHQPGFRTESFVVVTTLTNAKKYRAEDLADLYRQRWNAELDLRAIKVSLGMDVLRSKSPEMVRREIWSCVLTYNLIRQTQLNAARQARLLPRQLSLTATIQKVAASWECVLLMDPQTQATLIEVQLQDLPCHRVGHRPNRVEPRAIKRRPKPHKLLTKPRNQAREELLAGHK
jgi:putative transposase